MSRRLALRRRTKPTRWSILGRGSSRRWRWSARARSSRAASRFRREKKARRAARTRDARATIPPRDAIGTTWTPCRTSRFDARRRARLRPRASRATRGVCGGTSPTGGWRSAEASSPRRPRRRWRVDTFQTRQTRQTRGTRGTTTRRPSSPGVIPLEPKKRLERYRGNRDSRLFPRSRDLTTTTTTRLLPSAWRFSVVRSSTSARRMRLVWLRSRRFWTRNTST